MKDLSKSPTRRGACTHNASLQHMLPSSTAAIACRQTPKITISFENVGVGDGDAMSLRNACYVVGGVTEEECLQAKIPYKQHAAADTSTTTEAAAAHHYYHHHGGVDENAIQQDNSNNDNNWSPFVFVEHVREVKRVLERYRALVAKYKDAKANKMKENQKENQARKELLRKLDEAQVNEKKTEAASP